VLSQTLGLHIGPAARAPAGSLVAALHQHQVIWHIKDCFLWKQHFSHYVLNHIWQ
jgi:hypothetical protein